MAQYLKDVSPYDVQQEAKAARLGLRNDPMPVPRGNGEMRASLESNFMIEWAPSVIGSKYFKDLAKRQIQADTESEFMGKPYASELTYIPNAYEWAMGMEIKPLTEVVRRLTAHSLISIGSGGSFTVAAFQALLHETLTGKPSYATTPYLALAKQNAIRNSAISIISAEGKNKDVLGCFQYLVDSEPQDLMALSLKLGSPLNELAASTHFASSLAFEMPWGKDGYLATNSLLASCLLIYRAYQQCFQNLLPSCYATSDAMMEACVEVDPSNIASFLQAIGDDRNQSYLVVTGLSGHLAGIDLESKIAESALGTAQVADFRSFAHGRHLWTYENRDNAAVIVIWSSDEERSLFDNLVETIPDSLPLLSIKLKGPAYLRQLAGVVSVIQFIHDLGKRHGIDPGRPEVQESGRKIYHLDAFSDPRQRHLASCHDWAIKRKFGGSHVYDEAYARRFRLEYEQFVDQLSKTTFCGIVFDYDATLCTPDDRFKPLDAKVAVALNYLLKQNITIGIATGRGKSVPEVLLKAISPELHDRCWVGMYNGSKLQKLSDPIESTKITGEPFVKLENLVNNDPFFRNVFKEIEGRPTQLTFTTKDGIYCELAWRGICEILAEPDFAHLKALRSTHSWDIVTHETSKSNVVKHVAQSGLPVLSIGDRGLWPGNDCELLSNNYGLGVDEISPATHKAWNIAPQGTKGVGAALYYLSRLNVHQGTFTFRVRTIV